MAKNASTGNKRNDILRQKADRLQLERGQEESERLEGEYGSLAEWDSSTDTYRQQHCNSTGHGRV